MGRRQTASASGRDLGNPPKGKQDEGTDRIPLRKEMQARSRAYLLVVEGSLDLEFEEEDQTL